jgi:predicted KAP-like P-loop ATPase
MFSDQPIKNSQTDLFGRKAFSKRIANIIANRTENESIAIGIHAPWGEGKTSVLNMIIEGLEEHLHQKSKTLLDGHIILLKFNPWRFSDETQLLENFFFALADKLEGRIETTGEKISDLMKKYSWVAAPLEAFKFGFLGIDASVNAKETIEKLAEAKPKADITVIKDRIEKILAESDKKIVVIMDDIDRLDKEEVQAIFRLIKLSADFSNTIYILSFDIERVSEALADKYGSKEAGKSFLEKIIQLSLPLPPLTSDKLIKLTYDNINKLLEDNKIELPKNEDSEWSYFFIRTFGSYLKSPRLVKKYINNLWFSMPETKDELNILDLQTIEAIHTFFPKLYKIIRDNKNVFLLEPSNPYFPREQEEKKHNEKLKKIVEDFPEEQQEIIKKIIQNLFPRTSGAFSNSHYGTDWHSRWTKEKKIASPKYFQRYFDFGVSDTDISDVELKQFVNNLTSQTEEKNVSEIKRLISNNREELFLQKISLLADNLEEDKTIKLAKAIALSGKLFPTGDFAANFLIQSPISHAAYLLRHLLEKIKDDNQRLRIAIEIATDIVPLNFAYEYFRFVQYIGRDKDKSDADKLTKLAQAVLDKIVERIETEANEEILEKRYPQNSANLYRVWLLEKPQNIKEYLKERFTKNPQEAEDFILSFAKQSWAVNGTAILWGLDFIISAIKGLHPKIKLLKLENYSKDSNYHPKTEKDYLIYFLSIAKINSKSKKTKRT